MFPRFLLGLIVLVSLAFAAPAQAAPGALNVLVTGNESWTVPELTTAIAAQPGVASAAAFVTSDATPTAAQLSGYDVVVSTGDSNYDDPSLFGDRLADYVDAGGAVLQAAYDNWDSPGAAPTGRFESGGYAPLLLGDNQNANVTLGSIELPNHPLVEGLGAFPTNYNTTTPLAPGATLVAKWSDDRNAIAYKGRVVAVSANPGGSNSSQPVARLAVNTGNFILGLSVSVSKSGSGLGTVTGTRFGVACGESCAGVFPIGTPFSFTATPAPNSRFAGWSGSCAGVGLCQLAIAPTNLNVGAVFELARFGSKTNVKLSATSAKVSSSGKLKIRVKNSNGFSTTGKLSGKSKLKSKSFTVKAGGSKAVQLKLTKSLRKTLVKNGRLKLTITAKVKDPAGGARSVRKKLTLKLKG